MAGTPSEQLSRAIRASARIKAALRETSRKIAEERQREIAENAKTQTGKQPTRP